MLMATRGRKTLRLTAHACHLREETAPGLGDDAETAAVHRNIAAPGYRFIGRVETPVEEMAAGCCCDRQPCCGRPRSRIRGAPNMTILTDGSRIDFNKRSGGRGSLPQVSLQAISQNRSELGNVVARFAKWSRGRARHSPLQAFGGRCAG